VDYIGFFRGFGTILYETLRHPTQTTVIERGSGRVSQRFNSWQEYVYREPESSYSRYIVVGGVRSRPKPNASQGG